MIPLARTASDHVPCVIRIGTNIPKAKIFRFESYWVGQPRFLELVDVVWAWEVKASNSATKIVAKFKNMRRILKKWAFGLSKLKALIKNCNEALLIIDNLEENRPHNTPEQQFGSILKKHISKLLKIRKSIGKRGTQSDGPNLEMKAQNSFMQLPLKGT
jgi:hypothetical protein